MTEARIVSRAKGLSLREEAGKTSLQQGGVVPSSRAASGEKGLLQQTRWPLVPDQIPCSSGGRCGAESMVGEVTATLYPVSRATWTAWIAWLETHSEVLGTTGQPGHAAYDPAGGQKPARRSIVAGCTAGWRSGGSGQMKRRRVNSLKWPTRAYRSCGHGSHPATRSRWDSTRREAAPWDLARSSS